MNAFELSSCGDPAPHAEAHASAEPGHAGGSLENVPGTLIAEHLPWVKRQAASLCRRLPANVERDDLVQVGLIAIAWAATAFVWEGGDGDDAQSAFMRFAQKRVKGAMLDELRRMDPLPRTQRRKLKQVQAARERLQAEDGKVPPLSALSAAAGMSVDEIARLSQFAHPIETSTSTDSDEPLPAIEPSTSADTVEAHVDSGLRMRWFQGFVSSLPDVDQQVIDCYLGEGPDPAQLARELKLSASAVSQRCKAVVERIARHLAIRERGTPSFVRTAALMPLPLPLPLRVDSQARWG